MTDLTCETALERMLEADPAELRGDGDTDLARHIAGCERCREVAAAMLAELDAVDHTLAGYAQPTGHDATTGTTARAHAADAAANAALAASRGEDADRVLPRTRRPDHAAAAGHGPPARSRWSRVAWIPLAAAAALATVLVLRPDSPFPAPGTSPAPANGTRASGPRVAVTTPPGRDAAIMETENPGITIVWLFPKEES